MTTSRIIDDDLVRLSEVLRASFDMDIVQDTLVVLLQQNQVPDNMIAWGRATAARIKRRRFRELKARKFMDTGDWYVIAATQLRRLEALEALGMAHIDLLRVAFGAPGRLTRRTRSYRRKKVG